MSEWDETVGDAPEAVACEYTEIPDEQLEDMLGRTDLARCEVTGTMHPPEDLVEFKGRLVSAEGKQILLRQLMGAQIDGKATVRPSFWRRALCSALDYVLVIIMWGVIGGIVGGFLGAMFMPNMFGYMGMYAPYIELVVILGTVLYYTILHAAWGKSPGKMAGRYRVVAMDGSPVTFTKSFVRALFSNGYGLFALGIILLSYPYVNPLVPLISLGYFLVNCIVLLADGNQQRAIHDRVAGTRVIMDPAGRFGR